MLIMVKFLWRKEQLQFPFFYSSCLNNYCIVYIISVELLADHSSFTITVRQLGPNSSVVNGQHLCYGSSAQMKHNDIIEVSSSVGKSQDTVILFPFKNL